MTGDTAHMVVRGVLAAAVAAVLLGGCTSPQAVSPGDGPDTSAPSNGASTEQGPPPEPAAATFADKYTYPDGVQVEVVQVRHGTVTGDDVANMADAKKGTPWQQLVVRVRNGSTQRLTDVYAGWTVTYGPDGLAVDTAYVPSAHDALISGTILPGKAKTGSQTFTIPTRYLGDVTLEFQFDGAHDPAVFAGKLP